MMKRKNCPLKEYLVILTLATAIRWSELTSSLV